MILNVPFACIIKLHRLEEHYTGNITLSPLGAIPKTFYFLMLNPYAGAEAEFSIFEDERMTAVLGEAVGEPVQGYNQHTGKPITNYDFSVTLDDPEIGLLCVLAMIISEGIYQAEILYRKEGAADKAEEVISYPFNHHWEQDFAGGSEKIARSFLASFGL